jgi:hypothetical protein
MTTWTRNADAAPTQTATGLPRVARTSEANIVLSGSSPRKTIGKTARMIAMCTSGAAFRQAKYVPSL